jgi:hypothetical protein
LRADEAVLTEAIVRLATQYGRYGYRRIGRLLLDEGWRVSVKRVYRIWRRESFALIRTLRKEKAPRKEGASLKMIRRTRSFCKQSS